MIQWLRSMLPFLAKQAATQAAVNGDDAARMTTVAAGYAPQAAATATAATATTAAKNPGLLSKAWNVASWPFKSFGNAGKTVLVGTAGSALINYGGEENSGIANGASQEIRGFADSIYEKITGQKRTGEKGLFGIGSVISGGLLYAAGHFLLDSPAIGMGLAALGAFVGQPIFDAIETNLKATAPQTPAQEPKKDAPVPAKQQESSHSLPDAGLKPLPTPTVTVNGKTQQPTQPGF